MFNHAIARQILPKHLSSDNDPLVRFIARRANLLALIIDRVLICGYGTPMHQNRSLAQ